MGTGAAIADRSTLGRLRRAILAVLVVAAAYTLLRALRVEAERRRRAEERASRLGRVLREVERLQRDLVTTIAHELRTPATVIKAANELLDRRAEQMTEEMRRELRDRIDENANRFASLLDRLLAYREVDIGRLEPDPQPAAAERLLERTRRLIVLDDDPARSGR